MVMGTVTNLYCLICNDSLYFEMIDTLNSNRTVTHVSSLPRLHVSRLRTATTNKDNLSYHIIPHNVNFATLVCMCM